MQKQAGASPHMKGLNSYLHVLAEKTQRVTPLSHVMEFSTEAHVFRPNLHHVPHGNVSRSSIVYHCKCCQLHLSSRIVHVVICHADSFFPCDRLVSLSATW